MAGLPEAEAVREVARCWPGRESQIAALHAWLSGRVASHLVVHGPPGTGKTGVVRHCLEAWGRRFAYVPLAQEYKLRQLFASVLSALWGCPPACLKRRREGGWGPTAGADSWNEFAEQLAAACPPSAPACSVLALDAFQWGAHRNMLPQLLAAVKSHRASLVVVVITSTAPQDVRFGPGVGVGLPLLQPLAFPAYDRDQLTSALAVHLPSGYGSAAASCSAAAAPEPASPPRTGAAAAAGAPIPAAAPGPGPSSGSGSGPGGGACAPPRELYATFVAAYVVSPFSPLTRSAADLAAIASWLWPVYSRPLEEGRVRSDLPPQATAKQLDAFMQHQGLVKLLLQAYTPGMRAPPPALAPLLTGAGAGAGGGSAGAAEKEGAGGAEAGGGALVGNLGRASKLLLLAAFVASRNKATLDKELFDFRQRPGGGRRRGAGRAGAPEQEADRQAEAAREARLKGPHAFPLTRLISIFHRLWASAPPLCDDLYGGLYEGGAGGASDAPGVLDVDLATGFKGGRGGTEALWSQSAAVLSSVTGLQGMGLLAKAGAGDDPLDQPRFTCAIDEPLAQRLAADLRITLQNYLMYDK
ncbi:hypothetical protein HYH03_007413 [Edaphochlamys debaryana]|uniref:Origin recognition complex subunit 5 n=1 Tax=Edaphochlamys debaryana TaxID=47281 RepID=A0A835Y1T3_9CHLO|nr:hypothetical protein HYH03_007413 [Edaphochlamys debaryana]|eukprot:KAG2494356.1 hypothetical protein HYH03_007413 [Edaphochlamys debaryana]